MQPQVRDGVAMTCVGDTVITVWNRSVDAESWRWHFDALRRVSNTHAQGMFVFNVIRAADTMPSAELRHQMQQDYRSLDPRLRHMVAVALGSSLWVNVLRAMLRSMSQIVGMSRRLSVVATIDEGLIIAKPYCSKLSPTELELRSIIDSLYASLGMASD